MAGLLSGVKRVVLWDFPRAGWQYDVIVVGILAFIFLTPRDLFRDQPKPSRVIMLPSESGTNVYWMEPELLKGVANSQQTTKAASLIQGRTGHSPKVVRLEPIFDAEKEIKGYMAYTTP